jgi:hypothetical protein
MKTTTVGLPVTVVLESSLMSRSAFWGAASHLPGPLYVLEEPQACARTVRLHGPTTLFLSRRTLLASDPAAQQELMDAVMRHKPRILFLLGRHEPKDTGPRPWPVDGYIYAPCAPLTLAQLALGQPAAEALLVPRGLTPPPQTWQGLPRVPPMFLTPGGVAEAALRAERLMQVDVESLAHHEVLGVAPQTPVPHLLGAYVALVRRFHPDALNGVRDPMLLAQARAVHRRITEAWLALNARHAARQVRQQHAPSAG